MPAPQLTGVFLQGHIAPVMLLVLDPSLRAQPHAYLHRRILSDATISRAVLGVTLNDTESLVSYFRETCPDAVPYAEETVVDLPYPHLRQPERYRSLGPYRECGVDFPFAWEATLEQFAIPLAMVTKPLMSSR